MIFTLWGFNAVRPDGRRIGMIIRWSPGHPAYPDPLTKAMSKGPGYSDWEELNFLPINAAEVYSDNHPWDWQNG